MELNARVVAQVGDIRDFDQRAMERMHNLSSLGSDAFQQHWKKGTLPIEELDLVTDIDRKHYVLGKKSKHDSDYVLVYVPTITSALLFTYPETVQKPINTFIWSFHNGFREYSGYELQSTKTFVTGTLNDLQYVYNGFVSSFPDSRPATASTPADAR